MSPSAASCCVASAIKRFSKRTLTRSSALQWTSTDHNINVPSPRTIHGRTRPLTNRYLPNLFAEHGERSAGCSYSRVVTPHPHKKRATRRPPLSTVPVWLPITSPRPAAWPRGFGQCSAVCRQARHDRPAIKRCCKADLFSPRLLTRSTKSKRDRPMPGDRGEVLATTDWIVCPGGKFLFFWDQALREARPGGDLP